MTDPYRTLGVSKTASQDEIRKAFKKLARKFHPDVNKDANAEDRFKEVNNAYAAVGDADKRKLWDEFGEASTKPGFDADRARQYSRGGFSGGGGFPGGGFPGGFGQSDFGGADVDDLFSSLFGGGRAPRARRGQDQRAAFEIDFLTAILGGEREITIPRQGASERLKVRIPAGVSDGGRLKLSGQGLPPPGGGPCGDLHLELKVTPHPTLRRRDKDDLELDLPLTMHEAMAGAVITVPTPTGDVKVTIPPGARPGQLLRLKGRGVQKRVPGALYLILQPTAPTSTDPAFLALAEQLEAAYDTDVRAALTR